MTLRITSALAAALTFALSAVAQSNPVYVEFSPSPTKGLLYRPDAGPAPHVGVLLTHRTANFLTHIATKELARRGFVVLAMNPRFENNETAVNWEEIARDVWSGVEYLRAQTGITHVVLLGHSGGGPTMTFYQAVAENGPSYGQGAGKLFPLRNDLSGVPPANGIVLVDAHPGNSINLLRSLNPAVLDESDPRQIDPAIDPFNPANGYDPRGPSTYSTAFKEKYFAAQAARMNRLIDDALAQRKAMAERKHRYPDNDIFVIPRSSGARLMNLDPSIHAGTVAPQKLLQNDGTIVTKIIEGVRPARPTSPDRNASFDDGARIYTLRSFLSTNAIRARDSMDDIDWCSSNNSTPCALQHISVPVLITAMGAHYFIRDNEIHYELAASEDKDFIVVEGATHGVTPCRECATTPGQYDNSVKNFFDYVADWINARF